MTTTILSKYGNTARIARWRDSVSLTLLFDDDDEEYDVLLPRAEFIEAVADELGVIVTEKADLPPVTGDDDLREWRVNGNLYVGGDGTREDMIARAEKQAHAWLAIAERVRNLPPEVQVDEDDVETLIVALESLDDLLHSVSDWTYEDLARRLLATVRDIEGAK